MENLTSSAPEPRAKYKDITIDGRQFRIGRLSATTGNFIAQSLGAAQKNEALFRSIQGYCFEACSWLKTESNGEPLPAPAPMKLFERPDRWLLAGMADDFDTAQQLYEEVLEFNLGNFMKRRIAEYEAEMAKRAQPIEVPASK